MKGDTVKLLSDDDGSRKRGVPCGHLARRISQGFISVTGRTRATAPTEQLRRDSADADPSRCRWSTWAKLCIFVSFEMRRCVFFVAFLNVLATARVE